MIGTIFLHFIIAMIATLAFAVLFQAPKSEWGLCGVTGGLGWLVYEYLHLQGWHLMLATIVATLVLTLLSRMFAVVRKHPATVYLLSGIFPLVPGAGIYYTAFYLITGNMEMFSTKGRETNRDSRSDRYRDHPCPWDSAGMAQPPGKEGKKVI